MLKRYFLFSGGNGYCGCEYQDVIIFNNEVTEAELMETSSELALDHAESFSYIATGWGENFENEDDEEFYYSNALEYATYKELTRKEYLDYCQNCGIKPENE